jgi:hypothetical protein
MDDRHTPVICVQPGARSLTFVRGDQVIARLAPPTVMGVTLERTGQVAGEGAPDVEYAGWGWTASDHITQTAPGRWTCDRTWRNASDTAQEVVLGCEIEHPGADPFYLIPAVSYNGNHWGGGSEPKGLIDTAGGAGQPWVFGGDRASVPGCTISESDGWMVALYGAEQDAAASGCSLAPIEGPAPRTGIVHRLYWPLEEGPRTYVARDRYAPAVRSMLRLAPGEACSRTFYVVIAPAPTPRQGYAAVLDDAWARCYHDVPARFTPGQLWHLGIRFAKESLWVETDDFVGFTIGLTRQDGRWVQHPGRRYEIGWCGQNAGLAAALLQDYVWSGDVDSWRRGAAVLNFWSMHARLDNGLFYTHYDDKLAGVPDPDLDTCNLGHGAYQFLLASELAEQAGQPRRAWREMGLAACEFFVHHALPNGKLGRAWGVDGRCKAADGTIGCSMVWPLAKAYRMTGRPEFLQTAERAYHAYADDDLARLACTAGALDTDCIDKETAFPLLVAGLDLFEITGDEYYLAAAERAAYYLATWQWHYRGIYPPGSPAAALGYDTFGGTSVSVQHHHLDPWAALIALGWLRLAQFTGRVIWRERATAAWRQSTIGVSDGALAIWGVLRPAGAQDEGFYHTRWSGSHGGAEYAGGPHGPAGGVSDWLVAWPAAFRLITLMHWRQWGDLA